MEDAMPITDYSVATGTGESPLSATVQLRNYVLNGIRGGWQPLGGVSLAAVQLPNGSYTFAASQAMGK
jgi:hypothetical protein